MICLIGMGFVSLCLELDWQAGGMLASENPTPPGHPGAANFATIARWTFASASRALTF
jgi:hypothetical protein